MPVLHEDTVQCTLLDTKKIYTAEKPLPDSWFCVFSEACALQPFQPSRHSSSLSSATRFLNHRSCVLLWPLGAWEPYHSTSLLLVGGGVLGFNEPPPPSSDAPASAPSHLQTAPISVASELKHNFAGLGNGSPASLLVWDATDAMKQLARKHTHASWLLLRHKKNIFRGFVESEPTAETHLHFSRVYVKITKCKKVIIKDV